MPIITLRDSFEDERVKRLRSLTFGSAGANKPYITKGLPPVGNEPSTGFGPYNDGANTSEASARIDDLSRISKLIVDKPGQKFAQNQALLNLPNQKGNIIKKVFGSTGTALKAVGSTLSQVPVNGTGTHFVYGFGGFEYLKEGSPGTTVLGRFLRQNLGIGNAGVNGAARALQGNTIITDNEGQPNYAPPGQSGLLDKNSKFDVQQGFDTNPYLRSDIKSVFNSIKGLFTKNEKDKRSNLLPNLSNIFKSSPLNIGQEGFRTEKNDDQININSDLQGPNNPDSYLNADGFSELDARSIIRGTPKGSNAKVVRDNDGGRGYEPQSPNLLENKPSTQTINVDGKTEDIRPDINPELDGYTKQNGKLSTSVESVESKRVEDELPEVPLTKKGGRQLASLGDKYNGQADGYVGSEEDEEGNVTIVQGDSYEPGEIPATKLRSFQEDEPNDEGYELKEGGVSRADDKGNRVTKLIDFRKVRKWGNSSGVESLFDENGFSSTTDISNINYTEQQIDVRLNMAGVEKYKENSELKPDEVNKLAAATAAVTSGLEEDIIPFYFISTSPTESKYLYFRAFLDNLTDDFNGEWSGTRYIGRAEEFYTYQGFKRDISFAFKIAAFSKEELVPLYEKLNLLAATTAPTYNSEGEFMRGTLTSVTIGDYITDQIGFISNVGISWNTSYQWEIDLFDEDLPKVPQVLDVSISFTPIHDFNVKSNLTAGQKYFG